MKKMIIILTVFFLLTAGVYAKGTQEQNFGPNAYHNAVAWYLGHNLNESEISIADSTYLWYNQKCDGNWNSELFDYAVDKGVANCKNPAMLVAAKTGEFGEKLLKALIISAGDAAEATSKWLERNSDRYDKKNN